MFDFFNNLKENEIKDFSSGNFKKLILHFNIDKTIVMRDSLKYNNPEYTVK